VGRPGRGERLLRLMYWGSQKGVLVARLGLAVRMRYLQCMLLYLSYVSITYRTVLLLEVLAIQWSCVLLIRKRSWLGHVEV